MVPTPPVESIRSLTFTLEQFARTLVSLARATYMLCNAISPASLVRHCPLLLLQLVMLTTLHPVQDTKCYSLGDTLIPVIPLSCDPLTIPATCPPGEVNMTAAKGVSGRPLDPAICAHFPYSNATRPFPDPLSGNINAPYPYTPAPVPPAPAPALSPPTPSPPAPITSAPPSSVVSPSPPSASRPPVGPSPSPPPSKAAGARGVSLAAAVLPLLAVVLMAGSASPESSCRLSRLHLLLPFRPPSVCSGLSRRNLARLAVSAEQRQGESDDGGSREQRGAGVRDDDTRDGGAGDKGLTGGDDSSRRRKAQDTEEVKGGVAGAVESLLRFITPRQKGDIRDITLVSLSFAILVYISQRLVCAYFALLAATQYW
ncbi:unnamed protein product [Closterium sp. NIES-53]